MNEDFNYAIVETVNNLSLAGVAVIFEPIVEEVEKIKGQYGRILRATAIGRDQAPSFNGGPEDWKDISKKWMQRKRTYPRNAFYRGISPTSKSLAAELFSLPGEKLFGRTTMRTRLEQVETEGFYNPRIRRRIDTVYRNDRGQFARANAEARRTVRIVVNPFPNIDRDTEDTIRELPISDANKMKLWANDADRPLIGPYTEWFFESKIRSKILNMVKGIRSGS